MTQLSEIIRSRRLLLAVVVFQLVLLFIIAAPRLSPRIFGDTYLLEAEPVDPIDPLRGAYVQVTYKGTNVDIFNSDVFSKDRLYVRLKRKGKYWQFGRYRSKRPSQHPYISCKNRDYDINCGIESLFLPQDKAASMGRKLARRGGIAKVKIDGSGRASLVSLDPR